MRERRCEWWPAGVFLACLTLVGSVNLWHPKGYGHMPELWSTNVLSRLTPVERLIAVGTLSLDDSPLPGTIDKVRIEGRFYSSKPPLPTFFYVPVSAVLTKLGWPLAERPAVHLVTLGLFFHWLPYAAAGIWALRTLRRRDWPPGVLEATAVALGLGVLPAYYALDVSNHVPAAAALLAGFLLLVRQRARPGWAGFLCGMGGAFEHTAFLFAAAFGVWVWRVLGWRRLTRFVVAALLPAMLTIGYYHALSGSPLPLYLQHELYDYPHSAFVDPGLDAHFKEGGTLAYLWAILVGPEGLVSLSPLLLVGFVGLGVVAVDRQWLVAGERAEGDLALACLVALAGAIVFVALFTRAGGNGSFGIRWFAHFMPLVACFVPSGAAWLMGGGPRLGRWAVGCLVLLSVCVAGVFALHGGAWARCIMNEWGHAVWCVGPR